MSAYTPGPWVAMYDRRRDNYQIYAGTTAGQRHWIATTKCESVPANHKANAHLIEAAPDLLAMLKVAQLWLDVDGRFDMQGINAAIAKAEGAS